MKSEFWIKIRWALNAQTCWSIRDSAEIDPETKLKPASQITQSISRYRSGREFGERTYQISLWSHGSKNHLPLNVAEHLIGDWRSLRSQTKAGASRHPRAASEASDHPPTAGDTEDNLRRHRAPPHPLQLSLTLSLSCFHQLQKISNDQMSYMSS